MDEATRLARRALGGPLPPWLGAELDALPEYLEDWPPEALLVLIRERLSVRAHRHLRDRLARARRDAARPAPARFAAHAGVQIAGRRAALACAASLRDQPGR